MKKKLWYTLLTVALIVVLAASLSVGALADEDPGVAVSKQVTVQEDGTYIVDLEAYATGTVVTTYETVPCDIILVLDTSSSMTEDDMTTATEYSTYSGRGNTNVSYSNNSNTSYYYKDSEDVYHQITITRTSSGWGYWTSYTHTITVDGYNTTKTHPNNNLSMTDLATYVANIVGDSSVLYNTLYTATPTTITRIAALKSAVNGFLEQVADQNALMTDAADYSTVSIVTYNATETSGSNADQGTLVRTGTQTTTAGSFVPVVWSGEGESKKVVSANAAATDMEALVNNIGTATGTRTDLGMGAAAAILNDLGTSTTRNHVVVLFTDGYPSTSGSSNFDTGYAQDAVEYAYTCKHTHGATVFSVAVLAGADPSIDPVSGSYSSTNIGNVNRMLHGISSNYPNATSYTASRLGERAEGEHYFTASTADDLKKIFSAIAQQTGGTSSPVSSEAVMKDVVSSSFTLPEGATADTISVKVVPWDSTTHTWSTDISYTDEQWVTACMTYKATEEETIEVTLSEDGKTIDITGFDYAAHYLATSLADKDKDGVNDQAAKLVISFPIQAKPSAVTGSSMATNGEASGIYLNGDATEAVIYFPVPHVTFTPVTYVVDYVTSDTSTDTKASTIKLDYTGVLKNVEMLDKPGDDYLIGVSAGDFEYTIYKGVYGTISFGDDEVDVQRRYVRYAPTTMNWNDYDRIFVKGESATEDDKDVWAMLAVIPANSVFYEDTYISQTKTVEYNNQTVTIEYTGIAYTGDWSTVGTEGKNQTQHAGDEMGWVTGLTDDSAYANDMAHTSSTAKAKASFTFSGTGVDIYSRTNGSTGTILVSVKSAAADNASGAKVSKTKIIDTKAAAGDFFAVPVCTFTDLPYGKYTVTITVTAGGAAEGRMTFYLDGVRVYNPIQPLEETDEVVQDETYGYGAKNLGAVFTEVRSLLDSGATSAALYIDEHTTTTEVTDVEAIEAAAKALSEAQAARDAYVEGTITPAKNAVSEAEYALSSAQAALTNATNIYNATADAYDDAVAALGDLQEGEEGYNELKAAVDAAQATMNEAEAKMEAAKSACETAQAKYNSEISDLQAALDAAIAGQAVYDAAVDAAREAYDEVNDGVVVGYITEAVVADYDKDGPNSELYLSSAQSVAINVEAGKTYYIGMSSLNGDEVTATINGTEVKLSHSVDLYYEATPANDGTVIVITNTSDSDAILSITKLRTTGEGNTSSGVTTTSTNDLFQAFKAMSAAPGAEYTGDVLTEAEAAAAEEVVVEETTPAETEEVTEIALDEDEITIENPETEETGDPAAEETTETTQEETTQSETSSSSSGSWYNFLSSFFGFFRR